MCLRRTTVKIVAETDLLVYKCLDKRKYGYITPFQYLRIDFDEDDTCLIKGGDGALQIEDVWYINKGVHAYVNKKRADRTSEQFKKDSGTQTHFAVIKKGSPYYIGDSEDVVTTELIVFRTKKAYKKYAEMHEVKNFE